jgi:hypothetical protein
MGTVARAAYDLRFDVTYSTYFVFTMSYHFASRWPSDLVSYDSKPGTKGRSKFAAIACWPRLSLDLDFETTYATEDKKKSDGGTVVYLFRHHRAKSNPADELRGKKQAIAI